MMLASRAGRIAQSPTMKVTAEALKLKASGVDVMDFGAGEPDFPTPAHISAAAHAAIDANFTKYTTNSGTEELKRAIAARYREDYGVEYATSDIIVSAGGKQALYNAALVLFGEGDEVITHSPGWPTLVEQIKLADATPVLVHTHADEGFRISAAPFIAAFTPRTRGVVINSPGNPTGALMPESEMQILAEEAARRDIWILVDLCYEKLIYDPTPHNLPGVLARSNPTRSDPVRFRLQGVRDDRLALRLGDRPEQGHRGVQRAAEPRDIQRLLDHAEGRHCCAERSAGMRRRDAGGVSPSPGSAVRLAREGAAVPLRHAGRGVLSVHRCVRVPLARWHPHVSGARDSHS